MSNHDEIMVDELRFGRMFNRLQRAGMYRRCGCAGCAPCAESARRLLRGVAQSGVFSGFYQPDRWGQRYRVYQRPMSGGTVNVLTDTADQPTVVDVSVEPDDGSQEEVSLGNVLMKKAPDRHRVAVEAVSRQFPLRFREVTQLQRVSEGPGLYVIQWGSGQYLGKADRLRRRLLEHSALMLRYGIDPSTRKWYVAHTPGSPQTLEHQILKALASLVGGPGNFKALAMTNQRTELELAL